MKTFKKVNFLKNSYENLVGLIFDSLSIDTIGRRIYWKNH